MVQLHIKRNDESQFLFNTSVNTSVDDCYNSIIMIYNGRLKIYRVCRELDQLKQYGTMHHPNIIGLAAERASELNLNDEWREKSVPVGEWVSNKDPFGRRNGKQPDEKMRNIITRAVEEAKALISKKQVQAGIFLTQKTIQDTLDMLQSTIMMVYPMNIPPHDVIRQELENCENLTGTQDSTEVIEASLAQLWFSNRLLERGKTLSDYIGRNEKTKVVLKVSRSGCGPPPKEPAISNEENKLMMLHAYKRQEELQINWQFKLIAHYLQLPANIFDDKSNN